MRMSGSRKLLRITFRCRRVEHAENIFLVERLHDRFVAEVDVEGRRPARASVIILIDDLGGVAAPVFDGIPYFFSNILPMRLDIVTGHARA